MRRNWRAAALVGLALGAAAGLMGCFARVEAPVEATLIFAPRLGAVGEPGEVTVSVAGMPGDGLAALAVGVRGLGLRYDPAQFQVTAVSGLNGFTILAACIDTSAGEVRFVAVNPAAGVVTGDVARIVGTRVGSGPAGFTVDKANLEPCDAGNALIETYTLTVGQPGPYFIKEGR